jgi:TonB family protein
MRGCIPIVVAGMLISLGAGGCEAPAVSPPPRPAAGTVPLKLPAEGPKPGLGLKDLDVIPIAVLTVRPNYPFELRRAGVTGDAWVEFIVGPDGTVRDAWAASATDPRFGSEAVKAVMAWKFKPGRKGGHPVSCRMQVPIQFRLSTGSEWPGYGGVAGPVSNSVPAPRPGVYQEDGVDEIPVGILVPGPELARSGGDWPSHPEALIVFTVEPDGAVDDVILEKTNDGRFGAAAVAAVRGWRFRPATVGDTPVPCRVERLVEAGTGQD